MCATNTQCCRLNCATLYKVITINRNLNNHSSKMQHLNSKSIAYRNTVRVHFTAEWGIQVHSADNMYLILDFYFNDALFSEIRKKFIDDQWRWLLPFLAAIIIISDDWIFHNTDLGSLPAPTNLYESVWFMQTICSCSIVTKTLDKKC